MGTLVHHWKETGETTDGKAAIDHTDTLERKLYRSGTSREKWWPPHLGKHEVTFAFNVFTLRLVLYKGPRGGADAWKKKFHSLMLFWQKREEWVTGTIDWLGKRSNGRVWVDDLKTGAWPVDVEASKQLRSYAIVPWLMELAPDDWECDVSITQWAKYPLDAEPERTWHVLTAFDLQEHIQDLRWALSNPGKVMPVPYGPPQKNEKTGKYDFGEKLPVCAGCECREPVPGVSEWNTNFWYRTLPHCVPGMMKLING